jgi:hypothetical protein
MQTETERVPCDVARKIEQRWVMALKRDADRWRRDRPSQPSPSYVMDRGNRNDRGNARQAANK